jgi:hypothetical protein
MNLSSPATADHQAITPSILYFGPPVLLLSTENEDGSANLAPMSSAWALGQLIVLGLVGTGQTARNLASRPDLVASLPEPGQWPRRLGSAHLQLPPLLRPRPRTRPHLPLPDPAVWPDHGMSSTRPSTARSSTSWCARTTSASGSAVSAAARSRPAANRPASSA